ncbi:MAG: hypothetical protein KGQ28_11535, partial [Hyphomicrobiales bacterium]|nr:hypothetical protein [Hyphomicrobiales bacterium]
AAAIGAYVGGLVLTELARFMIVYATLPFVSGAFAWGLYGERPTGRAMSAALVALVGIAVMMAGPGGGAHWLGDALSAVSTIGFAGLLVAARHRAGTPMSLVNGLGALLCVPLGLAFARPVGLGAWQAGMIAWFGASTLYLAFRLYMTGVRDVPAAEASVVSAADSALGPLWVFLVFGETPSRATLEGGAIVMAAVLWQLIGGLADARRGAATAEP